MDQPRVPAAPSPNPHGGEWTSASGTPLTPWQRGWVKRAPEREDRTAKESEKPQSHVEMLAEMTPLTVEQQQAVTFYRDTGVYYKISGSLRNSDDYEENYGENDKFPDVDVPKVIKNLDEAIAAQKPTEKDIFVYRGMNAGAIDPEIVYMFPSDSTGQKGAAEFLRAYSSLNDASFVSTSTSERKATEFAGSASIPLVLRIKIPKGTKVLPIASGEQMKTAGEEEILLARNTHIKLHSLVGASKHHGGHAFVVDAEVT